MDTLYSPHYGRVSYIHSAALDKPIAVRRYRYGRGPQFNQSWEDLTAYPHYNWKGLASGDKKALSLDPTTTDIEWAAKDARAYGQIPISTNAPKSWFGSLIIEQRDASGLHYRRARYYDPVTGRFTQEDPIGLAGGLNLYGYANGDPVNFSDPFGLCPQCGPAALAAIGVGAIRMLSNAYSGRPTWENVGRDALAAGAVVFTLGTSLMPAAAAASGAGALGAAAAGAASGGSQALTVQFGRVANQVEHAFRHTDAMGLDRAAVQSAITQHLPTVASQMQAGRSMNQVISVAGQRIQYTAYEVAKGVINVGRIHEAK